MKRVDHWIGLPLCFICGIIASVARKIFRPRRREVSGKGRIVVIKFFGLGSIVQATPLLKAIRKEYTDAPLTFLTFPSNESLVDRLNIFDDVRIIRTNSLLIFIYDTLRIIMWLRVHRIEAVIDLEFFSKFSTLLSFLSRAPIRVGFHLNDFWRYSLITHPIYFNYFRHITDVYEMAGRQIKVSISDQTLRVVEPGSEAREAARRFLEKNKISSDVILLGMNINASELSYTRRWPLEYWTELINTLLEKYDNINIVLTGTGKEQAHVELLIDKISQDYHSRIIMAAGQVSLLEFLALISNMDGFVTNDSGPMHMAAMLGVPMLSLWGSSRPEFYAPRVKNHQWIYVDYHCSPCVNMFTAFDGMWCNNEAWCMKEISPSMVLEKVDHLIEEITQESS